MTFDPAESSPISTPFDEDRFRKTLVYSRRGTVAQIQSDLQQLKQLDLQSQRLSTQFGWMAGLSIFGLFVCGFFTMFSLASQFSLGIILCVGLGVACVIVAIYSLIQYFHNRNTDVENRRYELADSLLHFLGADIRSATEVELTLDFHHYHSKTYLQGKVGSSATYQLPWLALKGKFADGNRFDFSAELKVKRKEKHKRKYTKVKEGSTQDLTLELRPSEATSERELLNHLSKIPPPPLFRYRAQVANGKMVLRAVTQRQQQVTGRGGTVSNSPVVTDLSELDQFLRLFLTAYHCWNTFPGRTSKK